MRKGEGRAQQIRGQKRHSKVVNMKNRRPLNKKQSNPGQEYWNALVNDEAQKIKNQKIESENKISTSQVNVTKPQVHRRKSGSA